MEQLKSGTAWIVLIMVGLTVAACGESEKKTPPSISENQPIIKQDSLSMERQFIEVDVSTLSNAKQGDIVEINTINEEETYHLQMRRVQQTIPGIISISANIEDRDTGLATLLIRDGELSGMMNFYKEGRKYRVDYDSTAATHYMQEMLPEEMDELEGSVPLIPKRGNQ